MKSLFAFMVTLSLWAGWHQQVYAQPRAFFDLSPASVADPSPTPHIASQPVSLLEVEPGDLVRLTVGFQFQPVGDVTRWYLLGALLQVNHPAVEIVTPNPSDIRENAFWHPDVTQQMLRAHVKAAASEQTPPLRANLLHPEDVSSAVFSPTGALWVVLAPGGSDLTQPWYVGHIYLRVKEDTAEGTQIPVTLTSVPDASGVLPNSLLATDGVRRYHRFGEHLPMQTATIHVRSAQTRLVAQVVLEDYLGSLQGRQVQMQIRTQGSTEPLEEHLLPLDSNGRLQVTTPLRGVYDISLKGEHWLRRTLSSINLNGTVQIETSLRNGDVDGDNEVSLFDFGMLVAAFGSFPEDSRWNPNADLDGDEEVSLFDFGILVRNFGAIGDE
jgi:hypothetical protein